MSEIKQALKAMERLANVQMNISLEEWSELSGVIIAALSSTAVAEREPVEFPDCVLSLIDGRITLAFETPDDAQVGFYIIERIISDPPPLSELEAENARLKVRLTEAMKDTARIDGLREMCGYVEDGSSDILKVCQDDATGDWLVRTGDAWPAHGRTLRHAIDAAIATHAVIRDAALEAKLAERVKVKPLEWDDRWTDNPSISSKSKRRIMERALAPFSAYFTEQDPDDDSWWVVEKLIGNEIAGPFASAQQAKAAAQADYEHRILSALEATPPAPKVTDDELSRYINRCREMSENGKYSWWSRLAEILTAAQEAGKP